jgi:hypothetical protein
MSKKVLNVDGIKNELEGASLYFTRPATPPSPAVEPSVLPEPLEATDTKPLPEIKVRKTRTRIVVDTAKDNKPKVDGTNERTFERTNQRTNVFTKNRSKIRHTFDIFADQLLTLREIAVDQEIMFGERVLLGDLVQQALDMFIAKEKNK